MQQEEFLACAMTNERTLYRVAKSILRQDADCADAVQDALLKGINASARLRNDEAVKSWLTRILINVCKDMLRRQARHPTTALTEDIFQGNESIQNELYEALHTLDEGIRLPLMLYYLEGFSIRETAQILHLPEGTIKRRLWNGRKQLRELLMEEAQ